MPKTMFVLRRSAFIGLSKDSQSKMHVFYIRREKIVSIVLEVC